MVTRGCRLDSRRRLAPGHFERLRLVAFEQPHDPPCRRRAQQADRQLVPGMRPQALDHNFVRLRATANQSRRRPGRHMPGLTAPRSDRLPAIRASVRFCAAGTGKAEPGDGSGKEFLGGVDGLAGQTGRGQFCAAGIPFRDRAHIDVELSAVSYQQSVLMEGILKLLS